MVTPEKVIRVMNYESGTYLTMIERGHSDFGRKMSFLETDALEGKEITRDEFAKEFEIASRLIVLDP